MNITFFPSIIICLTSKQMGITSNLENLKTATEDKKTCRREHQNSKPLRERKINQCESRRRF
ncbi:hypothetical protein E1A91_D12G192300v1 [Gossypium mustelinum]|uniref:Uncharacterized protein n=1 Tax=Gossypium mustelinum TaxID=34275 RepID=A0A5D2SFL8_GOSMU|nr:hypothetical protein E1A91_D12G192300v1 [Gossypium mustelinum]